jgi:hypothetical protein
LNSETVVMGAERGGVSAGRARNERWPINTRQTSVSRRAPSFDPGRPPAAHASPGRKLQGIRTKGVGPGATIRQWRESRGRTEKRRRSVTRVYAKNIARARRARRCAPLLLTRREVEEPSATAIAAAHSERRRAMVMGVVWVRKVGWRVPFTLSPRSPPPPLLSWP